MRFGVDLVQDVSSSEANSYQNDKFHWNYSRTVLNTMLHCVSKQINKSESYNL